MGVGAIFISSLTLDKLPTLQPDTPAGQGELLAAILQPIVSFVALDSIIIRKDLTNPHFSFELMFAIYTRRPLHSIIHLRKACLSRTVSTTHMWRVLKVKNPTVSPACPASRCQYLSTCLDPASEKKPGSPIEVPVVGSTITDDRHAIPHLTRSPKAMFTTTSIEVLGAGNSAAKDFPLLPPYLLVA